MAIKVKALKDFRHDEDAEENGKWTTLADGVEFKIRRLRSKVVNKAREKIYGPHERAMGPRKKELPAQLEEMCTIRLLSEAVVVDWRGPGMVDDENKPIPFSVENCAEVLSDPDTGKDLRVTIINLSMDGEFFSPDDEDVKADAGNS